MKKLLTLLLSLTLVLALAGCGAEQTATYKMVTDQDGIVLTDIQVIKAKGDSVQRLTETTTIDVTSLDEATQEQVAALYDATYEPMLKDTPVGVTSSYGMKDGIYTVSIDIDLASANLKELIEGGYIVMLTDNADTIKFVSYKQTCEGLESSGYTLQE